MPGAVAPELNGEDAAAAADIQAVLVLADPARKQVPPAEEAALGRDEHARVDRELWEWKRIEDAAEVVMPGLGLGLRLTPRGSFLDHRERGPLVSRPGRRQGELGVTRGSDALVEAPGWTGHVAEVRVNA